MKVRQKILMYHSVGTSASQEIGAGLYCVSVTNFREQMQEVHSPQSMIHNKVTVTFDDGLEDNYTNAYPILREFGLKAYFFILVGRVGTRGYMNWQQILELKDGGMIIGSHGMSHRILTGLSDEELDYELGESKKVLENSLGKSVDYFSIPRGFCNKMVIEKAKKTGYKTVFTSNLKDRDGFKIGRIPVKGSWDLGYFIKVINRGYSIKDIAKEKLKNYAKIILGAKNYDRIRTRILKK